MQTFLREWNNETIWLFLGYKVVINNLKDFFLFPINFDERNQNLSDHKVVNF